VDFEDAIQCLTASSMAHIRFDLPRCEAWVFNSYYKHMPGVKIEDFREDFMSMSAIFDKAGVRMTALIAEWANKLTSGVIHITPQTMQDFGYLGFWQEVNMTVERADAWRRAEMLVNGELAGEDPYSIEDGEVKGDITEGEYDKDIQELPDGMDPQHGDPSPNLDEDESHAKYDDASPETIRNIPASKRIRIINGLLTKTWRWNMLFEGTFNDDEDLILHILKSSTDAFSFIVDGSNAWSLMFAIDFSQAKTLRKMFQEKYYGFTGTYTLAGLIKKCGNGETASWEQLMILDILKANSGSRLAEIIKPVGVRDILSDLGEHNYVMGRQYLKNNFYAHMHTTSAYNVVKQALDDWGTFEWEESMVMDILEKHPNRHLIVQRIGVSSEGDAGSDHGNFKNGINQLEWTLDGSDEDRLHKLFGL
ncbi:MAG: hypothetical protein AAF570_23350, partial [Bacteroidota bacterium]